MSSELIAREAEGQMGYWTRGHKGQLVRQKNIGTKLLSLVKARKKRFSRHCFGFQSRHFSLVVSYNIKRSSSSTNQNAALIIGGRNYRVLN